MKIGFIGLGNMGAGMAANLQKAGYELIVHDIVREAAADHIERGAQWADTPEEVALASEIVFTSLPGPKEVESVATGPNGILAGISAGKVYVDLSTVYPAVVRRIHEKFSEAGAHMLEAPVSGSTIGANTGRLAIMAGGEKEVYERCKPLFDAMGDRPTYTGPIGTGAVCKLAHNCLSYGIQAIAAECYTLGVKAGADARGSGRGDPKRRGGPRSAFQLRVLRDILQGEIRRAPFSHQGRGKRRRARARTRPRTRRSHDDRQHRLRGAHHGPEPRLGG